MESVDVLGSSHLPKAYFRPTDALIALPMANGYGERMFAESLFSYDDAFVNSPLPVTPHKTRVVGDPAVAAILAALDMATERGRAALLDG